MTFAIISRNGATRLSNNYTGIITRWLYAQVCCVMRVGLGYRSPTRRAVRSPLYFNSLVMAASVCRIMEQKIMLLRNGSAGFTYENVPLRTLTSCFCRAGIFENVIYDVTHNYM